MGNVDFDHKDIQDLARKVGTLEPFFTEKELSLLLAIFAAAVDRTNVPETGHGVLPGARIDAQEPAPPGGAQPTLTDLQQQLLNAYYPGNVHGVGGQGGGAGKSSGGGFTAKITGTPPIH
jgi:hypothetical protein